MMSPMLYREFSRTSCHAVYHRILSSTLASAIPAASLSHALTYASCSSGESNIRPLPYTRSWSASLSTHGSMRVTDPPATARPVERYAALRRGFTTVPVIGEGAGRHDPHVLRRIGNVRVGEDGVAGGHGTRLGRRGEVRIEVRYGDGEGDVGGGGGVGEAEPTGEGLPPRRPPLLLLRRSNFGIAPPVAGGDLDPAARRSPPLPVVVVVIVFLLLLFESQSRC